jgi:hypothetical protein
MSIRGLNRSGQTLFSYFFRFRSLFNSRGVRMPESFKRICVVER